MSFNFGNANEQQKEAIQATEGPLLIIAGPGTGKTYTLVKRIAYLITEQGVKPEEIMVATFTDKAAEELVTRITNELLEAKVTVDLNEMYIGTFHSLCRRILDDHLEFTGITKNYRMLDDFDQTYMVSRHLKEFKEVDGYGQVIQNSGGVWKDSASLVKYMNTLREEMVDAEAMENDEDSRISTLGTMLLQYEGLLASENVIDFSGLQVETYHLLSENEQVLQELQSKIKYIMVDEYQDTNYIQECLLFTIAGDNHNICVVGDDDQGLYRFRGATIRNILEFGDKFDQGECKQINLTLNYRSEKGIIDFYNQWMRETRYVARGRQCGFEWGRFRYQKEIKSGRYKRSRYPSVVKCSGMNDLEKWCNSVYKLIVKLRKEGKCTDYNQIAFLCRSVKNQNVVALIHYLEAHGVGVYSPRSDMYFERKEIKEAIGCLIACFPDYLENYQNKSFVFNPKELFAYYDECMKAARKAQKDHDELAAWIAEKKKAHKLPLKENTDYAFTGLFYQMIQFEPFKSYIGIDLKSGIVDERPARNLSIFTSILGKYEYLQNVDVFDKKNIKFTVEFFFNNFMRFQKETGVTEYEDDSEYAPSGCVSFMTIHQSKGMEFPVVIVDSLDSNPWGKPDELLEKVADGYYHRERFEPTKDIPHFDFYRLFYTAFSRAQNLLVLTCNENGSNRPVPAECFQKMYNMLPGMEDLNMSKLKLGDVKPVNIKNKYSFTSHIELYENCPRQYKYFKELGFTQVRVAHTLFGSLVHETIEDVHRAAMRHEEDTITPKNVKIWFDSNYITLSKREHAYLGAPQREAAYKQVLKYIERTKNDWTKIQDAEVEVSMVKPDYILSGKIDLIKGEGNTVEIVDFKSEKKPETLLETGNQERHRKQLEVYAKLVTEKTGKKVSRMNLYYTGEDKEPVVSFKNNPKHVEDTMKEFDEVVRKIENKDFDRRAKDRKLCDNCDFRYFCKEDKE